MDKNQRNKLAQFNIEDFQHILSVRAGNGPQDSEEDKNMDLQKYLMKTFNKDKVEDIDIEEVKEVLKPKSVVSERLKYRKNIGSLISGRQKVSVVKGEK